MEKNRGFTLAELLIVVAIIAVLVAISIPIFTSQLEKSREAADLANVRAAYAEVMAAAISEDKAATYNGNQIYYSVAGERQGFQAVVSLKQKKTDWQSNSDGLELGGVSTDDITHWIGVPEADGACTVRVADGETFIEWSGSYHNYFGIFADAVWNSEYVKKNPNGSNVLNSTYGSAASVFKDIIKALNDAGFDDVKTWAAVRDPADNISGDKNSAKRYNYLVSTFSITDNALRDKQIPAMYMDKNGNYSVGYATVKQAPDGKNNVITVGENGSYAAINNKTYDANFKSSSLISGATEYGSNRYAAEAAYRKLVKDYLADNPGMKEQ